MKLKNSTKAASILYMCVKSEFDIVWQNLTYNLIISF